MIAQTSPEFMSYLRTFLSLLLGPALTLAVLLPGEGLGKPIYNPHSKSYFELRNDLVGNEDTWLRAKSAAERLHYKGERGRLAVVDSLQVHQFLVENFDLTEETWIGLRFWCKYKKLQWINGKVHRRDSFNHWDSRWYRYEGSTDANLGWCRTDATVATGFMPVYYLPKEKGYRWQAVGAAKGFRSYLVEYPTSSE